MENCKYCNEPLEEGTTLCPHCGKENAEPQLTEATEQTPLAAEETPEAAQEETALETAEETAQEETAEEAAEETAEEAAEDDSEEAPVKTVKPGRLALVIGALVVLVAVLAALVLNGVDKVALAQLLPEPTAATVPPTTLPDGNPDDVSCKGSYTAKDKTVKKRADDVIATAGSEELTVAEFQIFYWQEIGAFMNQYGSYASYFGLDASKPLDTQMCSVFNGYTWQQFFVYCALNSWHSYVSMNQAALDAGFEMTPENLAFVTGLADLMDQEAVTKGFKNTEEMMAYNMGAVATVEDYISFMEMYYRAVDYYTAFQSTVTATAEEVEALFAEREAQYAANGLTKDTKTVSVRHILITPVASDGVSVTEEDDAAAAAKAQQILDEWLAGDATEESFHTLATQYSEDPGSVKDGGLYPQVSQGTMVPEFDAWCFDPSRQIGDYDIVKTDYGYHIMYYCGDESIWYQLVEQDVINEKINAFTDNATASMPMTVDYAKILIAQAGKFA